jgi:hypothetical protein
MNTSKISFTVAATLLLASGLFTGCASTDEGGTHVSNNYYGVGYQDPWYHGNYHDDDDVIVTPPPVNPPDQGLRPAHPIAMPPSRPSIPSAPRPAPRPAARGGGRR